MHVYNQFASALLMFELIKKMCIATSFEIEYSDNISDSSCQFFLLFAVFHEFSCKCGDIIISPGWRLTRKYSINFEDFSFPHTKIFKKCQKFHFFDFLYINTRIDGSAARTVDNIGFSAKFPNEYDSFFCFSRSKCFGSW